MEVRAISKDLRLRLIGADMPSGEIAAKDLAAVVGALQDVITRIGREIVNNAGPGRAKLFMEESSELRFRGISSGSTVLDLAKGSADMLDVDVEEVELADRRFWEVVESIRDNHRPNWVTDLIAESVARLIDALQAAAPQTSVGSSTHDEVVIHSDLVRSTTWTPRRVHTADIASAAGRLEKVDLRTHEFRVRDDVGFGVDLKRVSDDVHAARLVGAWVMATGTSVMAGTRLVALEDVTIQEVVDPARTFQDDSIRTLEEILSSATGPNPRGGLDIDSDELEALLEAGD